MKKKLSVRLAALALVLLASFFGLYAPEAGQPPALPPDIVAEAPVYTVPATTVAQTESPDITAPTDILLDADGSYTTKEDVALYIHVYGCLPANFMTKNEARSLGWDGGGLEYFAPGFCIGGDRFGNREGLLPDAPGRVWTECDIDTLDRDSRGARRIVFSNDGLIYYTDDHYASFTLLYGEESYE